MTNTSKLAALCGAVGLALIAISGTAAADGYEVAAPAAADEGRKFTYSFNLGVTSDYVFRGISQTDNDPTMQGGIDLGYGILYAGVWVIRHRFRRHLQRRQGRDRLVRRHQADLARRHLRLRRDLLHLSRRQLQCSAAVALDLNYVELKAGVSGTIHENLALGGYIYWSPDYFAETGSVWTVRRSPLATRSSRSASSHRPSPA